MKECVLPHPKNDVHEVLIDPNGMIWMPEHAARSRRTKALLGFNPKTEKCEHIDSTGSGQRREESHQVDAVGSLRLEEQPLRRMDHGRCDQQVRSAAKKVTGLPGAEHQRHSYGVVADKNDNIWMAMWGRGKIAKFDTHTNTWTDYHAAHLSRPDPASECGLSEQHLVGHLGRRQSARASWRSWIRQPAG